MEKTNLKRHICRRTDIVKMFFNLANAIRTSGRELFWSPTDSGAVYTFRLGNRTMTYTIQEGGAL